MPAKNEDLHGNAPDKSDVALLLIDVINDLEFPDGDQLLTHALPMARNIAALKDRAKRAGDGVVGLAGVVERQHHEPVRDRLQAGHGRRQGEQGGEGGDVSGHGRAPGRGRGRCG